MEQKRKQTKRNKKKTVKQKIQYYGSSILKSEQFSQASTETHHVHGTVTEHTLAVCTASLWMAEALKKIGVRVNEKDLVEASLCHDLGMIGRDEKYQDSKEAWKQHPEESLKIARELVPDLSENAEYLIRSHMWPLGGSMPRSREAVILNIADKAGSLADWKNYLVRTGKKLLPNK